MAAAELVDDPHLAGLMVKEAWRRARRHIRVPSLPFSGLIAASRHDRLLAQPREFRRGDRAIAEAIYGGRFEFAGFAPAMDDRSPFERHDAPEAWLAELYAFEWLRHLSEAEDAIHAENARALVGDFLLLRRRQRSFVSARPEIMARRQIALLTHSRVVLARANAGFRRRFIAALAGEARLLRGVAPETADGLPRLTVRTALAFSALCLPSGASHIKAAAHHLAVELDRQIFPDGGHVSRNPDTVGLVLGMLLPLRQLFSVRGQGMPRGVFGAIDRMLPALRFFRHADGATALFNGSGSGDQQLVAALLRHDETLGEPMSHMRQSGYHRLADHGTVVIADAGLAPPREVSGAAHAGTLAFEFSSGRQRFVVNCGSSRHADPRWRRMARSTAAHSTLTVADHSSSRFPRSPLLDRFLGGLLVGGPARVPASREDEDGGQRLIMAHDGYRAAFGLVHGREIRLCDHGHVIEGVDRLHRAAGRGTRPHAGAPLEATLRFHLHPDVVAESAGRGIRLAGGDEVWWFFADGPVALEDSIFFADPSGARRTRQIVATVETRRSQIEWRFERQH